MRKGAAAAMLTLALACGLCIALGLANALAIDISPSKKTADPKTYSGGKAGKFSLFTSDPKRIFRANAIDFRSLATTIDVQPKPLSLSQIKAGTAAPFFKVVLAIKNSGKKPITLSFPNAQRYDIRITNSAGRVVYQWSGDKDFAEEYGTILLNYDDRASYSVEILLAEIEGGLPPGQYRIEGRINNYPELKSEADFVVGP